MAVDQTDGADVLSGPRRIAAGVLVAVAFVPAAAALILAFVAAGLALGASRLRPRPTAGAEDVSLPVPHREQPPVEAKAAPAAITIPRPDGPQWYVGSGGHA